jgi:hypothetical protein
MDNTAQGEVAEVNKNDASQKNIIIAGYVFALLGGLVGVFIGQYLSGYRKTLPSGEVVFAHSDNVRKHGRYILTLGTIMLLVVCFLKLTRKI